MHAKQAPRLLRLASAVIAALIAAWFRYAGPRHASPECTAYDGLGALHWLGCGLLPMTSGADDDAILQPFTPWADEARAHPPAPAGVRHALDARLIATRCGALGPHRASTLVGPQARRGRVQRVRGTRL